MKIKNERIIIDKEKAQSIIQEYNLNKDVCFLYLDGNKLLNKASYYKELAIKLNLPKTFSKNLDSYSDMMSDHFTYNNKNKVIILINHYNSFLKDNLNFKKDIDNIFDEDILPWFENDIVKFVVGAKRISFTLYCCQ